MKKILLLAFALVSILKLNAQSPCGTDELDAYLKRTNPQYAAERQKMEQHIYSILKNKQNNSNERIMQNECQQLTGVITLPIVVHVIHKGEVIGNGTNISDAQIQSAIQGMNERWRRITGDGIDMEIQFALAVRDTNNNATNGITRFDGRVFPRYSTNGVHYNDTASVGANEDSIIKKTVWDRSRYINIWIADISGAGGWASLYGNYTFFVHYNSSASTYAHEMGHTFGLYHTFNGDGSGSGVNPSTQCPLNNDCLLNGDLICDTPPHKKEECSTTSCAVSGDLQNSFKNYMSYCGGTRFTLGQKDRVHELLYDEYYWSLVNSVSLVPLNTSLEVGIVSIENDLSVPLCNGFIPKIKIKNSGNATINNLKISTYVNGVLNNITNLNTNLLSNSTAVYNINSINFSSLGQNNIRFFISEMNGNTSDYFSFNNQNCQDIFVRANPVSNLCLNFESENINSFLFKNTYFEDDTIFRPSIAFLNTCSRTNTKVLKFDLFNKVKLSSYGGSIYLPQFNLDSVYSAYLTFDRSYKNANVGQYLYLQFYILNGCDSTEKSLCCGSYNSVGLASVAGRDSINPWIPSNCSDWVRDSVPITNYKGMNNLDVKIYLGRQFGIGIQNLYLDNFCIHKRYKITASVNPIAGGYIQYSNGSGIYDDGQSATVSATTYSCYNFKNWTENGVVVSVNPNYTFTVNKNRNLIANFDRKIVSLSLSVNPVNSGTTIGSGVYPCDTSVKIIAHQNYGYNFDYWSDSLTDYISSDSIVDVYVYQKTKIVAIFTPKSYLINFTFSPFGWSDFTYEYYNTQYTVTADTSNNNCFQFKNWTKNGVIVSTKAVYTFEVTEDVNLIANYEKRKYNISLISNFPNAGTLTGGGTFQPNNCDTVITIKAQDNSCYVFKNWSENGVIFSYAPTYTINLKYYYPNNRTLTAIFEPKRYNITLAANPTNGGTVSGAGNFACDSMLTVKAKIKTGYKFLNWMEGSSIVSTDSNYTFLISGARSLKANFGLATGIKQTSINEISKIYPNPTSDVLQLEIHSKQNTSLTLNIIDMKGSLLETKNITNTKGVLTTSFDVSKLAKGNYILNLYDEEGMASYKFVVQ